VLVHQRAQLRESTGLGPAAPHGLSAREGPLPFYATRSLEIDIVPIALDNGEIIRLADVIEGVAGEFSPFAVAENHTSGTQQLQ
jgi:hypothetical protein